MVVSGYGVPRPARATMAVMSEEVLMQGSADAFDRIYDGSGEAAGRVARHAERPGFVISEMRMSPAQRVAWHLEHASNCACRPMPKSVLAALEAEQRSDPNS